MSSYKIINTKLPNTINAPSSKSQTMRAILFASIADGNSIISNYLVSPDTDAMINACQKLGASIKKNDNKLTIIGFAGQPSLPDDIIDAGNSGIVLRFITAILATINGYSVITGDHSIRYNRVIKPLVDGLNLLGAKCISTKQDDYAPIIIQGPIAAGSAVLSGEDSQPVSALLIVSILLDGITKIKVQNPGEKPWVQLTLDWLDKLGVNYTNNDFTHYTVQSKIISGFNYIVPGDFSSIAYPIAAALITNSSVKIKNIDMLGSQGDKKIIDVLIDMGANIIIKPQELIIKPSKLHGCKIDVNDFIDTLPILAVIGCYATGVTELTNAAIARHKESDRLATITAELTKMGADIIESADSLLIKNSKLFGADVTSHNDHRIAMSLAVAALGASSPSTINNIACVNKSYASFSHDLAIG